MLVESWQFMKVVRARPTSASLKPWADLAGRALAPPGLNQPEILLPVLARTPDAALAIVEQDGRLILGLPLRGRNTLISPLSNSGLPLLDSNLGEAALAAVLRHQRVPMVFNGVPAVGPFREALGRAAGHLLVLERWQRAGLRVAGTYDDWFETNFDRKRKNALRRMQSKVMALAGYDCRALGAGEDVAPWIDALLDLEAAGWKGARGTALNKVSGMAEAFAEAARNLHAAGKLRLWGMSAEGQTLATVFAVVDKGHATFGKIAYNENYARYSPGVLIMLAATQSLFAGGDVNLADSSATPNHPMIDHLWRDRIAMADVIVAGPQVSGTAFMLHAGLERTRRKLRAAARDAYYRLTQRQRS